MEEPFVHRIFNNKQNEIKNSMFYRDLVLQKRIRTKR